MQSSLTKVIMVLIAFWVIVWVFIKITAEETTTVTEHPHNTLPIDFEQFYERFHNDSIYQIKHIDFPIEGIMKNDSFIGYKYWTSEEWKMHRPLLKLSSFNVNYGMSDNLVVETIADRSGEYRMERRFIKVNDLWELVYYEEMGPKFE